MFFLVGPTAVGKTDIAAAVAEQCNAEIIGADAFQVYRGMDVLTAKPSREIRTRVPHHLVDVIPLTQDFNVAQYAEAALKCARKIAARGKMPIVVGGTGLYVKALTHGLSELPTADAAIRAELEACTLENLQAQLAKLDPACAAAIDTKNKRRLIRAIEVCRLTGRPFSQFRNNWNQPPAARACVLLTRNREDLYERINQRVDAMFRNGLLDEVRNLGAMSKTASQVIGLKEARACLDGKISEKECVALIQQATRRYAKRQLTWFRRESMFVPVDLSASFSSHTTIQSILEIARGPHRPTNV
jgi:tRNA dimethylallyltransferase